jgi:RecA/RadA recombinase
MGNFDEIKNLTKALNKKYGRKVVKTGNEIERVVKIPFREPKLDYITNGGLPLNRFTEFLGEPSSGKSRDAAIMLESFQHYCFNCHTFSLKCSWQLDKDGFPEVKSIKCKCKEPKTCVNVIIDIEGTIELDFLEFFDIDTNGIYICRSESPSMTANLLQAYLENPLVGLIIADGIGMQSSDAELETAAEDIKMNSGARVSNIAIRKWLSALNKNTNTYEGTSPTTVILINRMYQTIGGMYNSEVPQGGGGLKHGKGLSIHRRRPNSGNVYKDAKTKDEIIGFFRKLSVIKSKTGIPEKKTEQYINLDPENAEGIGYLRADLNLEYIDIAIDLGLITSKGGWYYFEDKKYHGREALNEAVKTEESIKKSVNKIIYGKEKI